MQQEQIISHELYIESEDKLHEALIRCKNCNHIVPKTMICLYCGAPILYRHPEKE